MANKKLSDDVITARMVELRNLRKLHAHDRKQITELKTELAAVCSENTELKQTVATLQIQIAELQTMVFGKKKRPPAGGTPAVPTHHALPKQTRNKASYRRSVPPASDNLPDEQLSYVSEWYAGFASIYQDLRQHLSEPYDEVVRTTQADALWERIQLLAQEPAPSSGEPDKLVRLKAQLLRTGKDRLFVCLPKDTPCDNNRAERDLRQLVLKRKRSFGSKTERGAKALATILSLCTTTWRTSPNNYFSQLASLAG